MATEAFKCIEPLRWFTRVGTAADHPRCAMQPGSPVYEGGETAAGDAVVLVDGHLFLARPGMPLLPGVLFLPYGDPVLAPGEPRRLRRLLAGIERAGRLSRVKGIALDDDPGFVLARAAGRPIVARAGPVIQARPSPFARRFFDAIERYDAFERMRDAGGTLFVQDSGFEPETSLRLVLRGERILDSLVILSALDRKATLADAGDVAVAAEIGRAVEPAALGGVSPSVLTRYPDAFLDAVVDAAVSVAEGVAQRQGIRAGSR